MVSDTIRNARLTVSQRRARGPANRLMWATDCPYQAAEGHGYAPSLALVRERLDFLSADERRAILHDTATGLFFKET